MAGPGLLSLFAAPFMKTLAPAMASRAAGLFPQIGQQPVMKAPSSAVRPGGLLGMDANTLMQLSAALAAGAESDSWATGLGGVAGVLANRQAAAQADQLRRQEMNRDDAREKRDFEYVRGRDRADDAFRDSEQDYRSERDRLDDEFRANREAFDQEEANIQRGFSERRLAIDEASAANKGAGFRILSAEEAAARNLPPSSIYQENTETGRVEPVTSTRDQSFTQDQSKVAGFASRMIASDQEIADLMGSGFSPTGVRGVTGMRSSQGRQYDRAVRDFGLAVLRRETGATINPQEREEIEAIYFPAFGDDPATIAAKAAARERAIQNYILESGGAYTDRYGEWTPRAPASPSAPGRRARDARGRLVIEGPNGWAYEDGTPYGG